LAQRCSDGERLSIATAPRSGAEAEEYFALLRQGFSAAAVDERGFDVLIAGRRLRVLFGSGVLAETLRGPLERLVVTPAGAGGSPDATVCVWDSASTGVPIAPFPWRADDVEADGRVAGFDGGRFRCLYRDDGAGFHAVSMFDTTTGVGYFWFADHERIHWYERAEPLRVAVHWAVAREGRFLAHASAVGTERGAVVLTGRGGAGKTTTTLASVGAGLRFVGDNYVLLALEDTGGVSAHGLYGTAKLWPQTLSRLPDLEAYVATRDVAPEEKLIVDVIRYRPESIVPELPVRAVVVPEVVGHGLTALARCSPVDALLALAPATVFQLPRSETALAGMAELVRRVPTYRLQLGAEVMDGPRALRSLLTEIGT
jgi:hypothetical protein